MTQFRAFTLIELLVVVAIIAILAGMLVPTIGMVRDRANSNKCMSNLRQLQAGAISYSIDWQEALPLFFYISPGGGIQGGTLWTQNKPFLEMASDGKVVNGSQSQFPVSLLCPLAKSNGTSPISLSTGYNPQIRPSAWANNSWIQPKASNAQSSKLVGFGDALDLSLPNDGTLDPNYWVSGVAESGPTVPEGQPLSGKKYTPAFRHKLKMNASFGDGHVESGNYKSMDVITRWNP
jgi:prepilin-type N-terminal cleavage/methylation domain-containing protein/prepilin-type processing-associated H-X9-DG protein